jgi:hypothetical protein
VLLVFEGSCTGEVRTDRKRPGEGEAEPRRRANSLSWTAHYNLLRAIATWAYTGLSGIVRKERKPLGLFHHKPTSHRWIVLRIENSIACLIAQWF